MATQIQHMLCIFQKRLKTAEKVFWPALRCWKHLKADRNTQKNTNLERRFSLEPGLRDLSRFSSSLKLFSRFSRNPFLSLFRVSRISPVWWLVWWAGGGKHFGNFKFFVSWVLKVLSSHFEAARTLPTLPFPGIWAGNFMSSKSIWFWFWRMLLLLLLFLPNARVNCSCWRRFDLAFSSNDFSSNNFSLNDFSSVSLNVGRSSMLNKIKEKK